jgi:hypothetical protein
LAKRPFRVCACGDHCFVELTKGFVALVDPADVPQLKDRYWSAHVVGRHVYAVSGRGTLMHREILSPPRDRSVDHINRCGHDNRRSNLRLCSQAENRCNSKSYSKTGFKGVQSRRNKWRAQIRVDRRVSHLGT